MFIRHSDIQLGGGVILNGDVNDTSDITKKYDIKDAEYDFTEIVKNIKPKTFRMKDEKEIGINKNHFGFIADEIKEVLPEDIENIVNENVDGYKTLNYMKLNSLLWGCVQEQQQKIEYLETRLFEVENFIKDFVKPKPKTKAKAKN